MRAFRPSPVVLRVLVLTLVLVLFSGCSLFNRNKKDQLSETETVELLYQRGVDMLNGRNWKAATRLFTVLITRFPFGPYTEQSQLNLAYVQFKDNKPDEAYSTVNRFIRTYPTHKHVDYAYFLRGLINFDRAGGLLERYAGLDMTKRNQVTLRQSFDDFSSLLSRYPQSRYAPDARQRMVYLRNMMAQAELNVALYYMKRGAYVASSNRAKSVIETYPGSPQVADALAVMAFSFHRLGQEPLAADAERVLQLNDPDHPYFQKGAWPRYPSNWRKLIPLYGRG